jgi:hypothetical protein
LAQEGDLIVSQQASTFTMFATLIEMVKAVWRFYFAADLSNFIITDIDILQPYTIVTKCYDEAEEDADAYHIMVANCTRLAQYGAKVDKDINGNFVPFTNISGMPTDLPGIMRPAELVGGVHNIGLLMWGSPHPCISSNNEELGYAWCGTKRFDHTPKTEAFETMMWYVPHGIVIMTFSSQYRCEFYQPQWHKAYIGRQLFVAKANMTLYAPMRSSSVTIDKISESDDVMVAMAVPGKHVHCVTYTENGDLAFAATIQRFLRAIKKEKLYGIALGAYAANLEIEATL